MKKELAAGGFGPTPGTIPGTKTFRIIVEFSNAPNEFPMDAAKGMALQSIPELPDTLPEDGVDYVWTVTNIRSAGRLQ